MFVTGFIILRLWRWNNTTHIIISVNHGIQWNGNVSQLYFNVYFITQWSRL